MSHFQLSFSDKPLLAFIVLLPLGEWHQTLKLICVRSQNFDCPVTWFGYQLIAKPGNRTAKTATVLWPDSYVNIEPMLTQFYEAIWHHYYVGHNENRIFFLITKQMWQCIIGWHIETWTKQLPFCRQNFKMQFYQRRVMNFDPNFN